MSQIFRLNQKYFAYMVDCHLQLRPLIIFEILIVFKKFLTRDPCVIFCGRILMIVVVGASLLEALDIHLAKYFATFLSLLYLWIS